jgi:hypothetical protein
VCKKTGEMGDGVGVGSGVLAPRGKMNVLNEKCYFLRSRIVIYLK